MSLLQEVRSTVAQSRYLNVTEQSSIGAVDSSLLTPLNGRFNQVVGYVDFEGNNEWFFVMNATTNQPLQIPNGYMPVYWYVFPIEPLTPSNETAEIYYGFSTSGTNTNVVLEIDYTSPFELNNSIVDNVIARTHQYNALYYTGYQYLVFRNRNYLTYSPTGVFQVILEYL